MESEIEGLINEGWKIRIKTKKNRRYITVRKGNKERSLGPYTDELWNKVKPADLSATPTLVLELKRRINQLEGAIAERGKTKRRKRQFKRKPDQEKTKSTPVIPQIYTLMRSQGTNSRKDAISQAIETQDFFNPYLLNHGLKTPKALVTFFEDKIKEQDEEIEALRVNIDRYVDRLIKIQLTNA